jgi:hypothetical protein
MRKGLYANIHAKRKRGGKMRKKGAKGAPTAANFRRAAMTAKKNFKRTTGANLKRPSKKVGNKRRASFCARMKGMKKKLTSAKTANDPNSRINKALRAWNC